VFVRRPRKHARMDTRLRGDEAEAAVLHALVRQGLTVWLPWSRSGASDLLIENPAGSMVKAQVKSGRVREGCVIANCRSTDHGGGRLTYAGRADVIMVHAAELAAQFVVPVDQAMGFFIRLRLEPPRNHQRSGVRFAHEHRLEDWVRAFAAGPGLAIAAGAMGA
jgi:hypothetical protein